MLGVERFVIKNVDTNPTTVLYVQPPPGNLAFTINSNTSSPALTVSGTYLVTYFETGAQVLSVELRNGNLAIGKLTTGASVDITAHFT